MRKAILISILVILAAAASWLVFSKTGKGTERTGKGNLIRVFEPKSGDLVQIPLKIKGEARGFWFFEASFPARIFDEHGRELGVVPIQAQGEWVTEDFVPFEGKLEFKTPLTETGFLVLEKDNPSGLPEQADELRIKVRFNPLPASETMTVRAYFNNSKLDPEFSCNKVFPVERKIAKTEAVARAALEELFLGPFEKEKAEGFFTNVNPEVKIQKLTVENGTARVDLNEQLEFQVGGSCRVSAIRSQITETLKQFPTVRSVIISVNGRTEDILQP